MIDLDNFKESLLTDLQWTTRTLCEYILQEIDKRKLKVVFGLELLTYPHIRKKTEVRVCFSLENNTSLVALRRMQVHLESKGILMLGDLGTPFSASSVKTRGFTFSGPVFKPLPKTRNWFKPLRK